MVAPGSTAGDSDGFGMKQRLRELEAQIATEVHSARAEVELFRAQAAASNGDNMEEQASNEMQVQAAKREILDNFDRSKENLKKFFVTQKNENQRLQVQIKQLKQENCGLQQSMIALQRRIADLENEMGS